MPGRMPPTSQLDWLISTTAMIVLSWSRATRDLLKSFGWGIAALHRLIKRRNCHLLAARPIASPRWRGVDSNFQYAGAVKLVVVPLLTRPVAWDGSAGGRGTPPPPREKAKGKSG